MTTNAFEYYARPRYQLGFFDALRYGLGTGVAVGLLVAITACAMWFPFTPALEAPYYALHHGVHSTQWYRAHQAARQREEAFCLGSGAVRMTLRCENVLLAGDESGDRAIVTIRARANAAWRAPDEQTNDAQLGSALDNAIAH